MKPKKHLSIVKVSDPASSSFDVLQNYRKVQPSAADAAPRTAVGDSASRNLAALQGKHPRPLKTTAADAPEKVEETQLENFEPNRQQDSTKTWKTAILDSKGNPQAITG